VQERTQKGTRAPYWIIRGVPREWISRERRSETYRACAFDSERECEMNIKPGAITRSSPVSYPRPLQGKTTEKISDPHSENRGCLFTDRSCELHFIRQRGNTNGVLLSLGLTIGG
jgi:hypothetical protein